MNQLHNLKIDLLALGGLFCATKSHQGHNTACLSSLALLWIKNVEPEMEIFYSWDSCRIVPLVVVDLVVLIEPPVSGAGKLLGEGEAKLGLGV